MRKLYKRAVKPPMYPPTVSPHARANRMHKRYVHTMHTGKCGAIRYASMEDYHSTPRKIGKDGNSLKVTLDRELLAELDLERGDRLVQSVENGRLVMQKAEWTVSDG